VKTDLQERKIQHILAHQAEFDELMTYHRDVREYFAEYANKPDLYERICWDLNLTPIPSEVFPGYSYEKLPETPGQIGFAYRVSGPRKHWLLMRNQPNPSMLFVCPEGRSKGTIRGYQWFSDKSGELKPSH
jgi:hypothetical protein